MIEQINIPNIVLEDALACADFFNNWHSNLPGGFMRRDCPKYEGFIDSPSPDRNGKTLRQFWKDVDDALTNSGVNLTKVEKLVTKLELGGWLDLNEYDALYLELHRLTAPAFITLQQQGYTRSSLIG